MKFKSHRFWKHENSRDVFILVAEVGHDSGTTATLLVEWMTQGVENFWPSYLLQEVVPTEVPIQEIRIDEANYSKWKPYTPHSKSIIFNKAADPEAQI